MAPTTGSSAGMVPADSSAVVSIPADEASANKAAGDAAAADTAPSEFAPGYMASQERDEEITKPTDGMLKKASEERGISGSDGTQGDSNTCVRERADASQDQENDEESPRGSRANDPITSQETTTLAPGESRRVQGKQDSTLEDLPTLPGNTETWKLPTSEVSAPQNSDNATSSTRFKTVDSTAEPPNEANRATLPTSNEDRGEQRIHDSGEHFAGIGPFRVNDDGANNTSDSSDHDSSFLVYSDDLFEDEIYTGETIWNDKLGKRVPIIQLPWPFAPRSSGPVVADSEDDDFQEDRWGGPRRRRRRRRFDWGYNQEPEVVEIHLPPLKNDEAEEARVEQGA